MYDGHPVLERKVQQRVGHSFSYQSSVIGFSLHNDTQGDDGLKTLQFRSGLDEEGNLKRTRSPDEDDLSARLESVEFRVGTVHEGLDKFLIEFAGDNRIRGRRLAYGSKSLWKGF